MVSEEGNRIMEQARDKGVSHLFVLSGFHLQLITGGISLIFRGRKSRYVMLVAAHLYVAVVGYTPSLTRALIALTISKAAILSQNPPSLLITYTFHAVLVPHHLFTYSAALSYTAVAAIIFLYPAVRALLFSPVSHLYHHPSFTLALGVHSNRSCRVPVVFSPSP